MENKKKTYIMISVVIVVLVLGGLMLAFPKNQTIQKLTPNFLKGVQSYAGEINGDDDYAELLVKPSLEIKDSKYVYIKDEWGMNCSFKRDDLNSFNDLPLDVMWKDNTKFGATIKDANSNLNMKLECKSNTEFKYDEQKDYYYFDVDNVKELHSRRILSVRDICNDICINKSIIINETIIYDEDEEENVTINNTKEICNEWFQPKCKYVLSKDNKILIVDFLGYYNPILDEVFIDPNVFDADPNCISLWKLDNGALATDSIGSNTLSTAGTVTADTSNYKEGDASADFPGSDDMLYRTDTNLISGTPYKSGESNKNISICLWFYFDTITFPDGDASLVTKYDSGSNLRSFRLKLEGDDNSFYWQTGHNSGGEWQISSAFGSAFVAGRWYHGGFTLDENGNYRARIWDDTAGDFLDSDLTGQFSNSVSITTASLVIGGQMYNGGYTAAEIDGQIDEVVIFDDILTVDEIDEIRAGTYTAEEPEYPIFSSYYDSNATLVGSGTGLFNVTITSTNGTVWLEINNTNITATNITSDVYNASAVFSTNGTYSYRWHSWGNGTDENYNVSAERSYTVNTTYELSITDPTTASPDSVNSGDNITITFDFLAGENNQTTGVTMNNVTIGGSFAEFVTTTTCSGTLDCSNYGAEASCNNCSECNWTTGGAGASHFDAFENGDDWSEEGDCGTYWDYDSATGSGNTGPQDGDSDDAGNNFVYMESSSGDCDGDPSTGYLVYIPEIDWDAGTNDNITFETNFYGDDADMGIMTMEQNTSGSWVDMGWSEEDDDGNSGLVWTKQSIDASALEGKGNLRFKYVVDDDYMADAAIDKFNVTSTGGNVCNEIGACSSCDLTECDTNCSTAGCSQGTTSQFGYVADVGWQINVTVPDFASGLKDLFVNATYSGNTRNDTETEAIDYGGVGEQCNPTLNENWDISDTQVCDGKETNVGTGKINILTGGILRLINGANVTSSGLNLATTGDQVFVDAGCELRSI